MPYFEHDGVRLFYLLEGYGSEAILLLHSWACDMHDWSFQIPMLVARGYTTITLDTRGHGRSALPPNGDYSPDTLASDAAALLNHLRVRQVLVAGHSTGAIVASILTLNSPELVKGLILVAAAYYWTGRERINLVEGLQTRDSPDRAASLFARALYTADTPAYLKAWHMRRARSTPAEAVSGLLRDQFGSGQKGLWEVMKVIGQFRKGPKFVVCGTETQKQQEGELGGTNWDQIHVINASTWPHQQAAESVNGLLAQWIENDLHNAYT